MPVVTIIMPVYNAETTVLAAIESVRGQSYPDWELLIIDGESTDGTLSILRGLTDVPGIRWFSEPDRGIYDAMNRGINRATGDWFYFLGSDDLLAPQALTTILPFLDANYKLVSGDVVFDNGYRMHSYLGPRTWLQNTLHHQSAFYHRSVFDHFRYDTTLRLLADYELNLLIYQKQWPVRATNQLIAVCHSGGASSDWKKSLQETNIVRQRFLTRGWKQWALSALMTLYYGQKQLRRQLYGHKI